MKKTLIRGVDKEREAQEHFHLTRPPRLEGKVKNAMMNPKRKKPVKTDRKGEAGSGLEGE
ncbi:MAG: hypothetical protein HGA38_04870 [Candidatus Moranbacteria bacterium]|nr:hypothetical protein [Candidatus Moranbacteria bacterium]NTW46077.1 hypothetical protein [Candidatus Moranbacteria bacterium]